ncbi:MAG: hypothetical protein ACI9BF_000324 [Candidatus Paceibacteria bacterium]|jgi:hypothetical protein
MAYIEADCSLIKKDGEVIGVSLVAQPQTEAERYCASMPKQLVDGTGTIEFEDGKIIFDNPDGGGYPGKVSFTIDEESSTALQELLTGDGELGLYNDGILTPGFKIVPEEMKDEGEKTGLVRL